MMKILTRLVAFTGFFCCLSALLPSCTHEPSGIENMDTVCFDSRILPLLRTSCGTAGCHDAGQEGFSASDYESVMKLVVPGKPRSSKLYTILVDINGEDMMPPDQPLTKDQRMLIEVWIAQGAMHTSCPPDTAGGGGVTTDSVCFTRNILPLMVSGCGTIGCHDASTHEEGYIFSDYETIMRKGIVPFNPDGSKIYEMVTKSGEDRMPPAPRSPLTAQQIADLKKWISEGALNSNCPVETCDTTASISYSAQLDPILSANCVGCHNSSTANGNVNLAGYEQVRTVATTVKNGQSLLAAVVKKLPGFVEMPPTFSLDECSIRTVELWIAQGALNN